MAARKSGKVHFKDYQSDAYLKQLAPLVEHLNANVLGEHDAKYDAKALAALVAQLLQFQEDALGANVRGGRGG